MTESSRDTANRPRPAYVYHVVGATLLAVAAPAHATCDGPLPLPGGYVAMGKLHVAPNASPGQVLGGPGAGQLVLSSGRCRSTFRHLEVFLKVAKRLSLRAPPSTTLHRFADGRTGGEVLDTGIPGIGAILEVNGDRIIAYAPFRWRVLADGRYLAHITTYLVKTGPIPPGIHEIRDLPIARLVEESGSQTLWYARLSATVIVDGEATSSATSTL